MSGVPKVHQGCPERLTPGPAAQCSIAGVQAELVGALIQALTTVSNGGIVVKMMPLGL